MKTTTQSTREPRVRKDYLIPDALWNEIEPRLPKHVTHHPLGCPRKRVDDRSAMNAIFFVLKTGCQWNALNANGVCSLKDRVSRSGLPSTERTGMISRWRKKPSPVFRSNDRSRQRRNGRACASIKDTTLMKCAGCSGDFTSFPIFDRGEKRHNV